MRLKVSAIDFFLMQMGEKRELFKAVERFFFFDQHYSGAGLVTLLVVRHGD